MTVRILCGDVREQLATMPDESVHCVVTSPPYWGLRDYGTAQWEGGDAGCDHSYFRGGNGEASAKQVTSGGTQKYQYTGTCKKCGAVRIDRQLGMEPTLGEHIETMVAVFREIRRVLRKDGTVWLNYGDCYAGYHGNKNAEIPTSAINGWVNGTNENLRGTALTSDRLKPKDLCMIPNRLAIALQEPYHLGPIKNEIDRAWLAGLIDADGCIGIRRENNGKWNPSYIPYLAVGCSDRLLVERCVEITGLGKVNIKSRAGDTDKRGIKQRRDGYVWRLDGQIASRVIRDIYPYLVQKQPQALVCNAMNVSQEGGRPTKSKPVAPDVVAYRQHLYETIKDLNQRRDVILPDLPDVKSNVEQGWWVRSEIIWSKPNPMPESVTDRPATAHEKIWLLTRSAKYFYDSEAVRTEQKDISLARLDRANSGTHAPGQSAHSGVAGPRAAKTDKQRGHSRRHAGFNDRWDAMPKKEQQSSGANLRNVWTVPTKGFSGAHYATFPPDLIVPCIKAGTSEKGCCAACGAPWVRESDITYTDGGPKHSGKARAGVRSGDAAMPYKTKHVETLGWWPSCKCNADLVPCTVLDPFIGSGTTAMVADRLGRDCIGIDLNPENVEMSVERIKGDAGMFASVAAE